MLFPSAGFDPSLMAARAADSGIWLVAATGMDPYEQNPAGGQNGSYPGMLPTRLSGSTCSAPSRTKKVPQKDLFP